jgi:biotin transport system substrate-specific component
MSIYLLVGAMGIPVFAGGKGGLAHFMGPTGGYLIGFAVCAFVTGVIAERANGRLAMNIFAVVVGSLLVYACGIPWLKLVTGMSWAKAVTVGMLPFLIGDVIKATSAILLARALRPLMGRQLQTVCTP